MKIYAYLAAAAILAGLLWGAAHVWNKAQRVDAAELAQHKAEADLKDYADKSLAAIEAFNAQAKIDHAADEAFGSRLTALEGAAADLRRAAARIPGHVENTDAKGITRSVLNPDWWLCQSANLSGDTTDAAACRARAGDGGVSH